MCRYRLVIFDVDGTLLDTREGLINAASEALSLMKYDKVDEAEITECIGPPLGKEFVKRGFIKESDYDLFNSTFRNLYKDKYLFQAKLYPGVIELLDSLKGRTVLAIATNKRDDYTHTLLDHVGLSPYFDIIKGTDFEGKLNKTDLINSCLSESGVSPSDTVLIGDTENDRKASAQANINFIGVSYGFGLRSEELPQNAEDIRRYL